MQSDARSIKGLKLRVHDSKASVLEGILARGDRRLGPVIERAFQHGARFDSWDDQLRLDAWKEALAHFEIQIERYLGTIPVKARLPWDHFDIGLEAGFLAREYRRAVASRASPPCGKVAGMFVHHTNTTDANADHRRLVCYDCGIACDMTKMRAQRIEFLSELGAHEPAVRRLPLAAVRPEQDSEATPPEPTPAAKPGKKLRFLPEALRPVRPGSPPSRFRLRFEKTGPAALLGHLDLIRELPRVIRRAGARTAYSQGFHPKPDMSFNPTLSLNVANLDEYLDVGLIDAPGPEELLERLNRAASDGLRFRAVLPLTASDRVVTTIITAARYAIALPESALDELGGRAGLAQRIAEFLEKTELKVRRNIEGVGKWVDVRSFVTSLQLGDERMLEAVERAGLIGRLLALDATISIGPRGSAKVLELVEAFAGRNDFPHRGVRVALLAGSGTPLDLELHKKPARPAPAEPLEPALP